MTRSKPAQSPAQMKARQSITGSKGAAQKVTPKSGAKRPLPEDSDGDEDDVDLSLQNGFAKGKKGKFVPLEGDANETSTDESEDSEEDPEGSDDSDDENGEGFEDDEEDDENDDDDEEEEDEDEEDEDDEESDDESEVENKGTELKSAKLTKVIEPTPNPHSKSQASTVGKSVQPVCRVVVPNPPRDVLALRKLMEKEGFTTSNIEVFNIPVAIAELPPGSDLNALINSEKKFSIDGKGVHFLSISGHADAFAQFSQETTDTLFIQNIPKFVTMEMLIAKLPHGCKPKSHKLLSDSRRNQPFNAASLVFCSKSEATTAYNSLAGLKFGDRHIRVTYSTPRQTGNTTPSYFRARVFNAPEDTTSEQILSLFPGASNATRANDGAFFLDFPDEATQRSATQGQKVLKKNTLKVEVRGGLQGNVMLIKNIPFDASEADLRSAFSEAVKINMEKRPDGTFRGSAIIEFRNCTAAKSALSGNVTIKGRRLFGHPIFVEVSPTGKSSAADKQTKSSVVNKLPPKTSAPPEIGSSSDDQDEPMEKINASKTGKTTKKAESSEDEMEDDDDDDEEEDEDEDDGTEDDVEEENKSGDSEDEGIDDASDEEIPTKSRKSQPQSFESSKKHNRGSSFGGGRGFTPRGRGFRGRSPRGGFRNRGGDRGRGGFQRGRGNRY